MTEDGKPTNAASATAAPTGHPGRRLLRGDVLISVALLVVFVAAFLGARSWPFDSKIFPMIVSGAGIVLVLLKLALVARPPRTTAAPAAHTVGDVELTDEDEEADEALEYIFETASRADWARALGWAGGFFLAFFLVGAIPTILAFTVLYLLLEARSTWLVSVVYALLLGGLLYAAQELLDILLPGGILFS